MTVHNKKKHTHTQVIIPPAKHCMQILESDKTKTFEYSNIFKRRTSLFL